MEISLIWAMASNGVIGRGDSLPWRLPKDMQFFMATTSGKPVIMGRKTFETMSAPLAGRTNIVLTSQPGYRAEGIKVVNTFADALRTARAQAELDGKNEIMIIGGSEVYRLGLMVATRLYVTRVQAEPEGDVFFPAVEG